MNEKHSWELDICWDCLVFIMFIFFYARPSVS